MDEFPPIEIGGEPFERGRQHGERAADLIETNLETREATAIGHTLVAQKFDH